MYPVRIPFGRADDFELPPLTHQPANDALSMQSDEEAKGASMSQLISPVALNTTASGQLKRSSEESVRLRSDTFRLLNVKYSIDRGDDEEPITVRKKVQFDGEDKGDVAVKITERSVAIRAEDVLALGKDRLGSEALAVLAKSEFVLLDDLRSSGLIIRYDAGRDGIILASSPP